MKFMKKIFLALALFAYIGSTSAVSLVKEDATCICFNEEKGKEKKKKNKKQCADSAKAEDKKDCSSAKAAEGKSCCAKKASTENKETTK
jgi:hypothetical protein